mmetsp:Transcript_40714/g.110063  ORF Transcript_40714/g.110063 Transcript_40714/m.110063 type:complete len:280 (+) Transcript_40714:151-990(+)
MSRASGARSPYGAPAKVPHSQVPHERIQNDVAEVQGAVLREHGSSFPQGADGCDRGHHLDVAGVVPPDGQQVLVHLLGDSEVVLNMVLPLIGSAAKHQVREDPEEELFTLLLGERIVELAFLHQYSLLDEVVERNALHVLIQSASNVPRLAYGANLLKLVEETHAGNLRPHLLPVHMQLCRAEDADACHLLKDAKHFTVSEEGLQHDLHLVGVNLLLHSEGAHGHVWPEAPLVEERLGVLAAEGPELRVREEMEGEGLLPRPSLGDIFYQKGHGSHCNC